MSSRATRDWLTRTVQIPGKVCKRLGVLGKSCFLTVGKARLRPRIPNRFPYTGQKWVSNDIVKIYPTRPKKSDLYQQTPNLLPIFLSQSASVHYIWEVSCSHWPEPRGAARVTESGNSLLNDDNVTIVVEYFRASCWPVVNLANVVDISSCCQPFGALLPPWRRELSTSFDARPRTNCEVCRAMHTTFSSC